MKAMKAMKTELSTKLIVLAISLMMNAAMIGSVAFLFDGPNRQSPNTDMQGRAQGDHARQAGAAWVAVA